MSSTADLKFLHRVQRVHHQELQTESGTRVIYLLVPLVSEVRMRDLLR